MHLQVIGEGDVANEIGDEREGEGGDHRGPDRQSVEPVRQVHRIGRAGNYEHPERDKEPAEIEQYVFEERDGKRVRTEQTKEYPVRYYGGTEAQFAATKAFAYLFPPRFEKPSRTQPEKSSAS